MAKLKRSMISTLELRHPLLVLAIFVSALSFNGVSVAQIDGSAKAQGSGGAAKRNVLTNGENALSGDRNALDSRENVLGESSNALEGRRDSAFSAGTNALDNRENGLGEGGNALESQRDSAFSEGANGLDNRENPLDGDNNGLRESGGLSSGEDSAFSTLNTGGIAGGDPAVTEIGISNDLDVAYTQTGQNLDNGLNGGNGLSPDNELNPQNTMSATNQMEGRQQSGLEPENTLETSNRMSGDEGLDDSQFANKLNRINADDSWKVSESAFDGELKVTVEKRNSLGGGNSLDSGNRMEQRSAF